MLRGCPLVDFSGLDDRNRGHFLRLFAERLVKSRKTDGIEGKRQMKCIGEIHSRTVPFKRQHGLLGGLAMNPWQAQKIPKKANDYFAWPVTRAQALLALDQFINTRLSQFCPYQDAMWTATPFGWHSLLSVALNLHLLDPREVIAAAQTAYQQNPNNGLASVEGFIRQVLGWREFIRGVYWLDMPQLASSNHYQHHRPLPSWYWTGQTRMACMRDTITQTLQYGYAHHIQRLMVTGQFGILAELDPKQVSDWYLAVYVDAIEWVELPNVAGMALYADGGRFTSKPYIASGQYIRRMSNYCGGCPYRPEQRTGPNACPVSTLYWYFLDKHEASLSKNPRTALMAKSISRLEPSERQAIRDQAQLTLENLNQL